MESQTEVLRMVSRLSILQAKFLKDINTLEEGRHNLDRRIESNRRHQRIFVRKAAGELMLALLIANLLPMQHLISL